MSASLLDILISAFIGVTLDNVAFVVLSVQALIKLFFYDYVKQCLHI